MLKQLKEIYNNLSSVLLDAEGNASIYGSAMDNNIIDENMRKLYDITQVEVLEKLTLNEIWETLHNAGYTIGDIEKMYAEWIYLNQK